MQKKIIIIEHQLRILTICSIFIMSLLLFTEAILDHIYSLPCRYQIIPYLYLSFMLILNRFFKVDYFTFLKISLVLFIINIVLAFYNIQHEFFHYWNDPVIATIHTESTRGWNLSFTNIDLNLMKLIISLWHLLISSYLFYVILDFLRKQL
ncbi:MAG: hypothetical protein K0R02_364 [Rickettsiaceae bacterium]|jgi:hypothetical protein|nr:hypothetical protein [Rickettsiaceae bacterium]